MSSPVLALADLFVKLFDEGELRQFLAGEPFELREALPSTGMSPKAFAFAAAETLLRYVEADRALFDRLEEARPRRAAEIRRARSRVVPDSPLEPGVVWCDGRYQLDERLGAGGFAEVWRATDRKSAMHVALKILHAYLADDRLARIRFVRGAQALVGLRHPGLVAVHLAEGCEGTRLYYVMDLVEGRSLKQIVEQPDRDRATLIELIGQVGEALAYCHEQGLVHRDVGPHNILVAKDGKARLVDFDLVGGDRFERLTATKPIGALPYLAPELLDGRAAPTPAADVYGLAMTAVFVLVGVECWSNAAALRNAEDLLMYTPADVALREVLRAALQREPQRRTQTVAEFCSALRSASARVGVESATGTPEFTEDGALRLWSTSPPELPKHLADAGVDLWPAEAVAQAVAGSPRSAAAFATIVPHLAGLTRVATVLALRGHRPAWLGLTRKDTPFLVCPGGHVVLYDSGPPDAEDLALARRYAPAGIPAALVDAWPGERPPDVAVLAEEIRRGVQHEPRWRSLARFTRSIEVHEAFDQVIGSSGKVAPRVMDALLGWLAGPPSIAALRGPIGAGRTHGLRLFAAHMAHEARIGGGTPVVLASAHGWRAPLRLSEVLAAAGYTAVESAAIRFAVASGECVLVLDDLDAPAQSMAGPPAYAQVEGELATWARVDGRILVASSPTFALSFDRVFDLATPFEPALSRLAEAMSDRLSNAATRQTGVRLGTISLLQLPQLGRALIEAGRDHGDLGPVRLRPAIERYLQSWCEHASLRAPGLTAEQHRLALETIAAAVWRDYPGLGSKALTRTLVDELPFGGGPAGRSSAQVAVDGAILTPARQNSITDEWLAAERERLMGVPLKPWRRHSERQAERDPDAVYFVHNTIFEVLLASHLARELAEGRLAALGGPRPSPNLCALVCAMPRWQQARAIVEEVLTSGRRVDLSERALLFALADPTLRSSLERPWRLSGAKLGGAALRGARLAGCELERAELVGADLREADLGGARLNGANLSCADLRGASLERANAADARLTGARVDGVNARGASFRGTSLFASSAGVGSPDFANADLAGADLEATLWSAPVGIERAMVEPHSHHCWSTTPGSFRDDAREVTALLSPPAFGWVNDIAWLPDGRALVSIDSSGHVVVWSARPLRPLRRWKAAAFGSTRLAISGDGRLLATWTEGQSARVWDMSSGAETHQGALAGLALSSAAWACTSITLALFASDGTTWLWKPERDALRRLTRAASGPASGAFLRDDTGLLRATATGSVELLDPSTDRVVAYNAYQSSGFGFAVSPDGRRIALKDFHRLAIVDIADGLADGSWLDIEELGTEPAIDWSPDGEYLVLGYGHSGHGAALWSVGARRWSHHLDAAQGRWLRLRFSPDGAWVIGVGAAGEVSLWDPRTGRRLEETARCGPGVAGVTVSPDRKTLLSCCGDKLQIWSLLGSGPPACRALVENELVCLLPDGSGVVAAREGVLAVEDLHGTRRRVLDRSARGGAGAWINGHLTCDQKVLVCRVEDDPRREFAAWELATGRKVLERSMQPGGPTRLYQAYTADLAHGLGIAAGQRAGKAVIDLWLADASLRRIVDQEQRCIYQLAVDAGGMWLASAPDGPAVSLWDLQRYVDEPDEIDARVVKLTTFALEGLLVDRLLFAPQGPTLAVACGDSVSLFDAATRARTHRFDGHGFRVHSLAFSADGRLLAVGDWSGQVRVWRIDTGALIFTAHVLPRGVVTRGARHNGSDHDVLGWYAQLGRHCVPVELFGGALADSEGIARELARELDFDGG